MCMAKVAKVLLFAAIAFLSLSYGSSQSERKPNSYRIVSNVEFNSENFYDNCVKNIYEDCYQNQDFTEDDIERARVFIQQRFMKVSQHKPLRPPCQKLIVRRDFKCLTHKQREHLLQVILVLYEKGVIDRFAELHWKYWGEIHKFAAFIPWHRWFMNEFENEMRKVSPDITLPYWANFEEYDQPHMSILWKYFGRAGNRFNDHCITNTVLSNLTECVRRQWIEDEFIPVYNPIEFIDSVLQRATKLSDWFEYVNNPHLKVHLNVGGWSGQMSVTDAPYDPIFFLYHDWLVEIAFFKWQLQNIDNLVPLTYNEGVILDPDTNQIRKASLSRDRLPYYSNVSIVEAFQVGFGDLCYIHDRNIAAINQILRKKKNSIPFNYRRLPSRLAQKYFPNFYSGNYTALHYVSKPMMDCNRRCRQMTIPADFSTSLNGRRLLRLYKHMSNLDITELVSRSEYDAAAFMASLNSAGYCSPYIIS